MKAVLQDLMACFQGIIPSIIATCGRDGEPNVTYLSQVYYCDERHVALSRQFFNKTQRNVEENPYATVIFHHPVTFETWRMRVRFVRAELDGPLFDTMAIRIQVIASHTGMTGVFKLLSADIYEVLSVDPIEGFLLPPDPILDAATSPIPSGPLTELRGVQVVSERIARARDLERLLSDALLALDELLGFSHSMVLLPDETGMRLVAIATRGYGSGGIGGEVAVGSGLIGTAAVRRRMIRMAGVGAELRYGRAIRGRVEECGQTGRLTPEIPLPGLPDAQAQLALPLLAGERLLGVLAVESHDPLCFDEWDEAFLQILANQIAMGIATMQSVEEDVPVATAIASASSAVGRAKAVSSSVAGADAPSTGSDPTPVRPKISKRSATPGTARRHALLYYRGDESIFVDGEYLIRNLPARILWRLLRLHEEEGRVEFTNRELRIDGSLGLPAIKDNLESRLILLRKRLDERCPDVRLVPLRRGTFRLELGAEIELAERP